MRKITVLFVDHAPLMGGAERSLLHLIKAIDKTKFNVVVACPEETAFASEATEAGAKVVRVDMERLRGVRNPFTVVARFLKGVSQLSRAARTERVDFIHSNVMRASFFALLGAKMAGVKYVWHVRDIHKETYYRLAFSTLADGIIAISKAVKNTLPKRNWAKVEVVYNSVDLSDFDRNAVDNQAFRNRIGVGDDVNLIGTVGWIAPWKELEIFLEAAARVAPIYPNARFIVIGESADARYNSYVAQLRLLGVSLLKDRLIWAGAQENMPEVMASLDVLVHSASQEPFGRVIIEAMAMGKPVIVPDTGGPAEIVDDRTTGILFCSGSVESLANAMSEILGRPDCGRSLGEAGVLRARDLFSMEAHARKVEDVYYRLLGFSRAEDNA